MLAHVPRLPFSLDPLIAEAKRRMRRRRALVGFGLLAVVGLAAGLTLAFRSPGGGGPAMATFANGVFFRYPAAWAEADWSCYFSSQFSPLVVLTTTRPAPKCTMLDSSFPPRDRLGANGIMVTAAALHPVLPPGTYKNPRWNTRIGGKPARVTVSYLHTNAMSGVTCPAGRRREYLAAQTAKLGWTAVICGPDYRTGEAAVRQMPASVRFGA